MVCNVSGRVICVKEAHPLNALLRILVMFDGIDT